MQYFDPVKLVFFVLFFHRKFNFTTYNYKTCALDKKKKAVGIMVERFFAALLMRRAISRIDENDCLRNKFLRAEFRVCSVNTAA